MFDKLKIACYHDLGYSESLLGADIEIFVKTFWLWHSFFLSLDFHFSKQFHSHYVNTIISEKIPISVWYCCIEYIGS
jgi:hypothetical protein